MLLVRGVDRANRRGSWIIDAGMGAILREVNVGSDNELSDFGPTHWGTDSNTVLYEHERKGVVKRSLTDGREEILYAYSPESAVSRIHRFEVSPDGKQLAFSGFLRDKTGTSLQIVTAGGSIELARRTAPEMITVQAWSADNQFILFTTLRTGAPPPHELWRVPVSGGPPERLGSIAGATQINPVAFNPKGWALAYTAGTPLQEIWMMENFLPR